MSPSEVADRAVEAAGRAVQAGQVSEAERLGRLAATMKKLSGQGGGRGRFDDEDEDEGVNERDKPKQCSLTCSPGACWKDELYAKLDKGLGETALFLDVQGQNLAHHYVEFARNMGLHVSDEDLEALRQVLRAKTPEAIARAAYQGYGAAMAPLPEWAREA